MSCANKFGSFERGIASMYLLQYFKLKRSVLHGPLAKVVPSFLFTHGDKSGLVVVSDAHLKTAHETRLVAIVRRMEASKARFKGTINILSKPAKANLPLSCLSMRTQNRIILI